MNYSLYRVRVHGLECIGDPIGAHLFLPLFYFIRDFIRYLLDAISGAHVLYAPFNECNKCTVRFAIGDPIGVQ